MSGRDPASAGPPTCRHNDAHAHLHNSQSRPQLCWQTPVHGCHSVQRMAPGMSAATPGAQTAFAPVASSVFFLPDSRETPAKLEEPSHDDALLDL